MRHKERLINGYCTPINKKLEDMCEVNNTIFSEFFLLGFHEFHQLRVLLFLIFLAIYLLIVTENLVIISLVSLCHHLQVPMYMFLRNLAMADLLLTSNIIPKLLQVTWLGGSAISNLSCFIQFYFHCVATYTQSLILTAMAVDRFLAVCHPLRYMSFMNQTFCFHLAFWPWTIPLIAIISETVLVSQLQFCASKILDHFFCDFVPIWQIASSDAEQVKFEDFFLTVLLAFAPFILIFISYIWIFVAIIKIRSIDGRQKAFSTSSSHLASVCTYYVPIIAIYMFPVGENTAYENKMKALLYTSLTPLMNPVLYSMRNQEIKKATQLVFYKRSIKIRRSSIFFLS
ncbi:olfactory receptor 1468-like [Hyperolius riggenbachi]|uniref:olfactory receptor 1468-like n=1 Tax=Hyperolius riggenbachi TaxID=752182 RepID=UPI0035A37F45